MEAAQARWADLVRQFKGLPSQAEKEALERRRRKERGETSEEESSAGSTSGASEVKKSAKKPVAVLEKLGQPILLYSALVVLVAGSATGLGVGWQLGEAKYQVWRSAADEAQAGHRSAAVDSYRADCLEVWGPWGPCSETCRGGTKERTSLVSQEAKEGGAECVRKERVLCNAQTYGYSEICPRALGECWEEPTRLPDGQLLFYRRTRELRKGFHFLAYARDQPLLRLCPRDDPDCPVRLRHAIGNARFCHPRTTPKPTTTTTTSTATTTTTTITTTTSTTTPAPVPYNAAQAPSSEPDSPSPGT